MMRYSLENAEMALSDAVFIYITEYTWQPPVREKKKKKPKSKNVKSEQDQRFLKAQAVIQNHSPACSCV